MGRVKIMEVFSDTEFEYVEKILKKAGIACYEYSEDTGGAYVAMNATNPIEIHIDEENLEKSRELLKDYDAA